MSEWQSKKISSPQHYKQKSGNTSRRNGTRNAGKLIGVALVLLLIFYVFSYLLPRVDITIIPESRTVTYEDAVTIVLDNGEYEQTTLEGRKIFRSGTTKEVFQTTGQKDIGEKAQGAITFFNYTGLSHPVMIEDGLETFDGKLFTITSPLTIPAATVSADGDIVPGTVSATAIALEAGEESNINPQKLFIQSVSPDKQLKIYAEAQQPLSGGTSEIVKVISEEDIIKAQERLRELLTDRLLREISEDLPKDQTYLRETFTLAEEAFSTEIAADAEAEEFNYELTAQGEVIVYQNNDLNMLVKDKLNSKLNPGEVFLSDSPQSVTIVSTTNDPAGNTVLTIRALWEVSQPVDIEVFRQEIYGLREADARRILLQQDSVADVHFDWNLAINRRIPNVASHVNIQLGLSQ